jgi:putative ABC transport system substrate-binding protein
MIRRLGLVTLLVVAVAPAADAQPTAKLHRIGVLEGADLEANAANLDAFRRGLADHGYVEGRNVVLEYRSSGGRPERFTDLARELVRLPVDLIVTRGTPAALAARQATRTIPIVMASSGDPVAEGIVASLARPGGNVTGLHVMAPPELGGQRLQLLRQAAPGSARIGLLWNPSNLYAPLLVSETERAARTLGVSLTRLPLERSASLERLFETAVLGQMEIDALVAVEDTFTFTYMARIVDFVTLSRLPAIYGFREFVDAGGLMSYGTDRRDLYRRAAGYVHRVLRGTSPGDLPVEPPVKFELAINRKTARALHLTLPPALLQRADHLVD